MTLQEQAVINLGFVPNAVHGEYDYTVENEEWGVRVWDEPIGPDAIIVHCFDYASVRIRHTGFAAPHVAEHNPSYDTITAITWAIRIAAEYNRLKKLARGMTPQQIIDTLNRWAVIEYLVDKDDNRQWNRVYINIPTTMDGEVFLINSEHPVHAVMEALAKALKQAEDQNAKQLPEEIMGNTYVPVDELPERWQASRRLR